jgi:hypothetical protein
VKFKYEATVWKESTFLSECPIADLELHKELLGWARQRGEVVFGKGAKEASWTFQLRQAGSARGCTLFGVHANGTIWPIWKNLPAPIAGRFTKGLCESPQFRTAISAGKLWCNAKLRDEGMLATLQASVNGCL